MNTPINLAAANHAVLREKLIREFDLDPEEQTLADTLEGISDFKELAVAALREAKRREAMAEAMDAIVMENKARRDRHVTAGERIRHAVAAAMQSAGESKIIAPDMMVSLRDGKPKVVVIGEVPREYCTAKEVLTPNKEAIRAGIEANTVHGFAYLSNAEPVLTVRTK